MLGIFWPATNLLESDVRSCCTDELKNWVLDWFAALIYLWVSIEENQSTDCTILGESVLLGVRPWWLDRRGKHLHGTRRFHALKFAPWAVDCSQGDYCLLFPTKLHWPSWELGTQVQVPRIVVRQRGGCLLGTSINNSLLQSPVVHTVFSSLSPLLPTSLRKYFLGK